MKYEQKEGCSSSGRVTGHASGCERQGWQGRSGGTQAEHASAPVLHSGAEVTAEAREVRSGS